MSAKYNSITHISRLTHREHYMVFRLLDEWDAGVTDNNHRDMSCFLWDDDHFIIMHFGHLFAHIIQPRRFK